METTILAGKQTLKFASQHTIAEIKSLGKADKLEIIKNPNTGLLFFVAGSVRGAVSTKGYQPNPVVSLCTIEGGDSMYILHSKSNANVVDTL
jgi:hypothetical protein